jgi:hypothetical protein
MPSPHPVSLTAAFNQFDRFASTGPGVAGLQKGISADPRIIGRGFRLKLGWFVLRRYRTHAGLGCSLDLFRYLFVPGDFRSKMLF